METRALYHAAAPSGPRNLTAPLGAWLRTLGFTTSEGHQGTTLAAHWLSGRGERFQFEYEWVAGASPDATCRLQACSASQAPFETLFTAQKVRRLKEVRLLLLGNVRFHNARLLAQLAPAAATSDL